MKGFSGLKTVVAVIAMTMLSVSVGTAFAAGNDSQSKDKISIAIVQYVQHPALDAANQGFLQGLHENGFPASKLDVHQFNAQGSTANNVQIAANLAVNDYDLIFAIATPSAQAVANAIDDTPVLFSAVTAPVAAGLVDSMEHPGGNVTGTTDANPVKAQLKLAKIINPDVETVGIVFSSGEMNSQVQVRWAKEAAKELGLTIIAKGVSRTSEVAQATNALGMVDAIYVPTDNMVVTALEALLKVAYARDILVIASDRGSVKRGAVASYAINYKKLGVQTGAMAARILKGKAEPATMPVESQSDYNIFLNKTAAKKVGVQLPEKLKAKAKKIYP